MDFPAFAYPVSPTFLPGAPLQAVSGADRPWCASVAALAAHRDGRKLMGLARNLTDDQVERSLVSAFQSAGIPPARAYRMVSSVRGMTIGDSHPTIDRVFGGLTLSDYQHDAIMHLPVGGGLLAMAVGLGKTVTACVLARHLARSQQFNKRCWIIAPINAMATWHKYVEELQKTFTDVRVISIDSAHKLVGADRAAGGVLIVDEVHMAGHFTARRTAALFQVRMGFDYCLGLTGTLMHGGVESAMTVLDLCVPGASQFANKYESGGYFHCLVKKVIGSRTRTGLERPTGENRKRLLEYLAHYAVVMTKHTPAVRNDVTIPEQHLEVIEFGDPDGESIDDCIVRIATSMIDPETGELPHASAIIHAALREGNAEKTGWIMDNFDADEPVVLLAEYHETLTLMRERLDADQIPYVYVDGGVVDGQRAHAVARFQAGEVPIFLAQIDAAGASIDLFRSHISIAIDHTQKANNYAQALGRTCRRGQVHECLHLDLVANCMQQLCVDRLRAADDFHTALSRVREVLDSLRP